MITTKAPYPHLLSWIEISKQAFDHNIAAIAARKNSDAQIAIVVKSNAYGHGLAHIGWLAQKNDHVNWICTFYASEALYLRAIGITKPLLILGVCDAPHDDIINADIDIMVDSIALLEELSTAAQLTKKPAHIHIKIDTGLSRFGFLEHELDDVITLLKNTPMVTCRGIMSHFASADGPDDQAPVIQGKKLQKIVDYFEQQSLPAPLVHIAASAGFLHQKQYTGNFLRLGGLVYGHYETMQPVLSWKARVVKIKDLEPGTPVSYGGTFVTDKKTRIALLPVGYADGYNRLWSGKAMVYINGQKFPIIGRITMNIIIADITDTPGAPAPAINVGDIATLLGPLEGITATDFARHQGTINYEITSSLRESLPRIIV